MSAPQIDAGIYCFQHVDFGEISRYPNGIEDIYDRKYDGMIVHNVFSRAEVDRVVERLARNDPPMRRTDMPWGHVHARVLVRANPDLVEYFDDAASFRHDCRLLFQGLPDFETRVEEVFRAISGGRPVAVAPGRDGASYTPATIRVLGEGDDLALHCGNQFLHELPEFRHLWTLVELRDQLSYFITLSEPDDGGELIVYDIEWGATPNSMVNGAPIRSVIENYRNMAVDPPPGAMLVFDGGRIWHRVSAVKGKRNRITIGGFAALSLDHKGIFYWS